LKKQISGLRILLVVPFTKPDYSGSGINAYNFARFLNSKGVNAKVLTFNRNLRLKRKESIDQVKIHRISYFNKNLLTKLLSLFIILPAYLVNIYRNDAIIIYGAHIIGYQIIIRMARLLGKTIIFRSLLLGADDLETILSKRSSINVGQTRSLFRKIDLYFAINPVFAESFTTNIGEEEKILLTPQGVDECRFVPAEKERVISLRKKLGIQENDFVIISVGFLTNRKGFSSAFKVLKDLPLDYKYIIAGEYDFGSHHFMLPFAAQAIEIRNSGIEMLGDKLCLTGAVENIIDYYQSADIVLINSKTEGLPNTLLEAMACGKTVLVKDIPGIRYLVKHLETGIVFGSNEEMHDWIVKLRDEPELREKIGRNAIEYIQNHASFEHTWTKMAERLAYQ